MKKREAREIERDYKMDGESVKITNDNLFSM